MSRKKEESKQPVKKGRPSIYSDELAKEICSRIMAGESLNKICSDESMPDKVTVCRWLADSEMKDFCNQYARAREVQAELMADEIIEIADDSSGDYMLTDNGFQENREFVSRSKLRVDARKWTASKLLPKRYGDKIGLDHTSNGETISFNVTKTYEADAETD